MTVAEPLPAGPTLLRHLAFWRSPVGQPRWARPALLFITVVAGFAYGWRMGSSIEIFYAAAVRSMSMSWHDFAYAAFDPAGTISVDKLPGAFWVQALSVRLFGVHTWAIALPQVIEGSLTVLVLYRAVRRLAGPAAGLIAASVLAVSPATVSLNRGNISDTLLVLLLVLAADVAVAALTGRRWSIVLAGFWVGLAFQAKMVEAWLVVPALALVFLIAAAASVRRRVLEVTAMVVVAVAVSFSWMVFVTLTPAAQRPYVDGSQHNSVFEQVFDYNGFGRVGQPSPNVTLGRTLDIPFLAAPPPRPTWNRLFAGSYGRDAGWLLPASLLVVVVGLSLRRRKPRTDPVRAGLILWGAWLLTFGVVFTVSGTIISYYLGALTPPVAGLLGIGAKLAWDGRHRITTNMAALATILATAVFAFWLLPGAGTGLPTWLGTTVLVLGIALAAALAARLILRDNQRLTSAALVGIGLAIILVPLVASESVVTNTLGPFDTPFQSTATTNFTRSFFGAPLQSISTLPTLEKARGDAPDLIATQTSVLAAPFIYATGQEVLPIGGYDGSSPEPTVKRLAALVAAGQFHIVLTAIKSTDPRIVWVTRHCLKVPAPPNTAGSHAVLPVGIYYCSPSN